MQDKQFIQTRARIPAPIGQKFGFVTVIKEDVDRMDGGSRTRYVAIKCDCGRVKSVRLSSLWAGNVKSCGCKSIHLRIQALRYGPNEQVKKERPSVGTMRFECRKLVIISLIEHGLITGKLPLSYIDTLTLKTREFLNEKEPYNFNQF